MPLTGRRRRSSKLGSGSLLLHAGALLIVLTLPALAPAKFIVEQLPPQHEVALAYQVRVYDAEVQLRLYRLDGHRDLLLDEQLASRGDRAYRAQPPLGSSGEVYQLRYVDRDGSEVVLATAVCIATHVAPSDQGAGSAPAPPIVCPQQPTVAAPRVIEPVQAEGKSAVPCGAHCPPAPPPRALTA